MWNGCCKDDCTGGYLHYHASHIWMQMNVLERQANTTQDSEKLRPEKNQKNDPG